MADRYGTTETVLARHETWQKGFKRLVMILALMLVTTLTAITMAFYAFSLNPEPRYFAAREDGGILPIVGVSEPFLTDNQVINFGTEAITRSMTMTFKSYQHDLNQASSYFLKPEGWNAFEQSLTASKTLEYIIKNNFIVSSVANGAVIIDRGPDNEGRYRWILQIPLTVTYESATLRDVQELLVNLEVVRVPTWEMSRGVAVRNVTIKIVRGG